ncbi:MAG: cysteine--tRNA ligase [Candidatus Margulisiibacteriota bacterium]|jgi:cysteinyl-tRNA synthetase
MKLYNTLSKTKEDFLPPDPNNVKMYVCGVTVYDECHLGHARAYITFDVVKRYLEYKGYKLKTIQNFTDIDDKIINRARESIKGQPNADLKTACREIAEKYTEDFFKVSDILGLKRSDEYPKATEHIQEIIDLVKVLISKGHAYEKDGDVYFRISSFKGYGKLSGRNLEDLKAGARVEVNAQKENPLDFVLWKSSKPEEPSWESPWGPGRPGWHIECSAMSSKYLGETFDIHGGGKDLIFPHHENEIAQSECASGKPFVKYWLHNGFLNINKEKMSKSLGNFLTLHQVIKKHKPEALRLFFLQTHYRSPIDFSEVQIIDAEKALERFHNIFRNDPEAVSEVTPVPEMDKYTEQFQKAMDDDLNTPQALAVLFELAKAINSNTDNSDKKAQIKTLLGLGKVLGLFQTPLAVNSAEDMDSEINRLLAERENARKEKNWKRSDEIRDLLKAQGIVLEDTAGGLRWHKG